MADRVRGAGSLVFLAAILVGFAMEDASGATPQATVGTPAADAPAPEDIAIPTDPVDLGVVSAPLRFTVGPGVALELADGRRYLDRLELRQPGTDQVLVNDLTMDDYVAGVAEMPGRWHPEALKAQAVAARTYAWHQGELGTFSGRGYDICDTVACQVFVGAAQEEGDQGARWRAAVDETSGEVLLDGEGGPILARYFSTSGGRTLPNEVVFPSSGSRPYLVGTDDPGDAVSPYHRWEVTFARTEFEEILTRGETVSAAVPLARVERLGPIDEPGADLRFTGRDGTEVVVDSVDLRTFVSSVAPELYPDRFPTARSDGLRPLPTTLPSSRFEVAVGDDEVVVSGRGWGHGVGMGQYGAKGRAEAGDTYDQILAAYYAGLEPTTSDRLPERIRVGLSDPSVGGVTPDGPATVSAAGERVATDAAGTWTLSVADGGLRLGAPPGWGDPAEVSRTEEAIGVPTVPGAIAVEAVSAVPGTATLQVDDDRGERVVDRPLGAEDAGRRIAVWDLTDVDGEPVPAGEYAVALVVTAADGTTDAAPLPVRVEAPASTTDALTGTRGSLPWLVGVLLIGGGVLGWAATRRRRPPAAAPPADPRRSR